MFPEIFETFPPIFSCFPKKTANSPEYLLVFPGNFRNIPPIPIYFHKKRRRIAQNIRLFFPWCVGFQQPTLDPPQVCEPRMNLNRSWHDDHSHAYNTSFSIKSYTKGLPSPILFMCFSAQTMPLLSLDTAPAYYNLGPKGSTAMLKHGRSVLSSLSARILT